MAIALRGTPTTATRTTAGALAVNVPTGTVAGDVLIYHVETTANTGAVSTPAGLTLIESKNNGSLGGTFADFYRVCDGSEPASYSFTLTGAGGSGVGRAYSGAANTNPVNQHSAHNQSGTTSATATTVTTTVDGCMLVIVSGCGSNQTFTNPAGFGNQAIAHLASAGATASCDKAQGAQGATGSITGTWTSGSNWTSVICLAPAIDGAASGSVPTLTLSAPSASATGGALSTGSLPTLALSGPAGTAIGGALGTGALPTQALTAPLATAVGGATATGSLATLTLVAISGTASATAADLHYIAGAVQPGRSVRYIAGRASRVAAGRIPRRTP